MLKILSVFIAFLIMFSIPANSYAAGTVYRSDYEAFPQVAVAIDVSGNEDQDAKSPLLAMGLSFFIPGAGQVYNGEIIKGISLFAGIAVLILASLLYIEPAAASAEKANKTNSLLEIATLVTRIGIPVLWVYNWGSAYQSADPVYQRKLREEQLKKEKEEALKNPLSGLFEIKLVSYRF